MFHLINSKDMNGGKTAILKWQDEKFYNALSGEKFCYT